MIQILDDSNSLLKKIVFNENLYAIALVNWDFQGYCEPPQPAYSCFAWIRGWFSHGY